MSSTKAKTDIQKALSVCRGSFIAAGFFSLFINFLMLVPAIYMLQLYDRVLTSGSKSTLGMLTVIVVVLFVTMGILEWVRSQILIKTSARLDTLLSDRLYNASFKQALISGGMKASSQPVDDMTSLRQFLSGNGLFAFFDSPWVPIYIAVMFIFHPWYGWVAVFTVLILLSIAIINEKLTAKPMQAANEIAINNRAQLNKNLRNAEVVQSMGMVNGLRQRWSKGNDQILDLQAGASVKAGSMTSLSKTIRLMAQSLILGIGAFLVLEQEITPGLMIAGSILLGRALAPIDMMIGAWKGFISARGQYKRLNEILAAIPEDEEKMPIPAPEGNLTVENIIVVPPGGRLPVIRGINFSLDAGESLGIVGPSAAGKSTLARALLGIWPVANGSVRLDGADVNHWDRTQLGPHVGYLPQDIELFEGSVNENIARFGEIDPNLVVQAAKLADVHEMILGLPQGYDTMIASVGGILSGGQKQRIGLARAVYGEPKLILLDEPNSNLDDKGEAALAASLKKLKEKGTTVVVITHKKGILAQMDRLLMLRDGQQAAFGSKEDIIKGIQNNASGLLNQKNQ